VQQLPASPTLRPATAAPRPDPASTNHEYEPAEHVIVLGAQQRRQIFDRPQVGLALPALALDGGGASRRNGSPLMRESIAPTSAV
jgi:hypothetical protein